MELNFPPPFLIMRNHLRNKCISKGILPQIRNDNKFHRDMK